MALEIISKLGKEQFKLAIFADINAYYKNGENYYIDTTINDIIEKSGYDLTPDIVSMQLNVEKTILTFDSGYYFTLSTEGYSNKTNYTDGYIENFYVSVKIYNSNNALVYSIINGNCAVKMVKNGETTLLPIYLFGAIDRETKKGYMLSARAEAHGASNTVKTNILYIGNTSFSSTLWYTLLSEGIVYDSDPWSDAGYSGIGGGDGTFDFKSDTIALPDLPSIDAVSSGFLQLFCGNLSSVLALSRYMWSTNFFDSIVKITSNPIDIIMGLYMYPFIVPTSTQKYIRAGNVITNISMGVPDSQILEIDCGSIDIPMFYGAYLDYEPFTKCDLFLPYCGTFPLSMDDIVGKTINVKYRIDLLTGVCGAYVVVDGSVKYNFTGTCAINIPISSRSFENIYNAIMGVVGSMHGGSSFGLPSVGSIAGAVTSGKNQIQHGGVCSGNAGYLGVQKPYLIFSVPNVAIPKGLNKYTGYPIYATYKLADLKGYTEIEEIHLENMGTATKEEIEKITTMLEGGVIL